MIERVDSSATLEPQSEAERLIFAEEAFRVDTQMLLHRLLEQKGLSRKDLAQRLGRSQARVSQYFSDECNLTLKTVAQIFFALGETPRIEAKPIAEASGARCDEELECEELELDAVFEAPIAATRVHHPYLVESCPPEVYLPEEALNSAGVVPHTLSAAKRHRAAPYRHPEVLESADAA